MSLLKDERLAQLSLNHNVARFVSFAPGDQRYRCSAGVDEASTGSVESAIAELMRWTKSVNVRTFVDDQSKSTDFVYGIRNLHDAVAAVRQYSAQGLYTIVNETVNIGDG